MRKNEQKQDKQFKRFKSGDSHAIYAVLDGERLHLYDFLMRMTGQISRSSEIINEVYESLSTEILESIDSAHELRLVLFATARRFSSDIWNAETSRLINAGLNSVGETKPSAADTQIQRIAPLLDKALRCLPGPEREVVWLHILRGFSSEDVAHIVGLDEHAVESLYLRGLGAIDAEIGEAFGPAQTALANLPLHPLPAALSNATVNLSMVMAGIKAKPAGLRSTKRTILFGLMLLGGAVWYFVPVAVIKTLVATYLPFLARL